MQTIHVLGLIFIASTGAVAAAGLVPAPAPADVNFVTEALQGDSTEVALGKIAEQRGAAPQTRAYGHMLVEDHGAHFEKLAALARGMGLTPKDELSEDGVKTRTMLLALNGAPFDAAFKHHMVEDHLDDLGKYRRELLAAASADLRKLADETVPTLAKHLKAAQAL